MSCDHLVLSLGTSYHQPTEDMCIADCIFRGFAYGFLDILNKHFQYVDQSRINPISLPYEMQSDIIQTTLNIDRARSSGLQAEYFKLCLSYCVVNVRWVHTSTCRLQSNGHARINPV